MSDETQIQTIVDPSEISLAKEVIVSIDQLETKLERNNLTNKHSSKSNKRSQMVRKLKRRNRKSLKNLKSSTGSLIHKLQKPSKLSNAKKLLLIKNLRAAAFATNKTSIFCIKKSKSLRKPSKKNVDVANHVDENPDTLQKVSQLPEFVTPEDEDDLPLAKFIEMKKLENQIKPDMDNNQEAEPTSLIPNNNNTIEKNDQGLNNNLNRPSTSTDELIQKLNSTPTTSILKRKLLNKVGEGSPLLSISLTACQIEVN